MEDFLQLFRGLLTFVYHCFDRIVIRGHVPLLTRPENIVHFFRDVHGVGVITNEVLRQRTDDYNEWVKAFASKQRIPLQWAEKGVRKEDYVRPWLARMERQGRHGVYFILKSMEVGSTFRSLDPRYRSATPTTASWPAHARASPIITSTSATRCWGRWRCAWGPFCPLRSTTILTGTTSSKASCAVAG